MDSRFYLVWKFIPDRCPVCAHKFSSSEDFRVWGGRGKGSFIQVQIRQAELFPDVYRIENSDDGIYKVENRHGMGFILCLHCQNVTLRVVYATQQVKTHAEAERLVEKEGFTCWEEVNSFGNMARPYTFLYPFGASELAKLEKSVQKARRLAAGGEDEDEGGDLFDCTIDPVLMELVNKMRGNQIAAAAQKQMESLFGEYWPKLEQTCRDFLLTAEVLKDQLTTLSEANPAIDFSPAVAAYSKALEKELREKIFLAFAHAPEAEQLPSAVGDPNLTRSLRALRAFVANPLYLPLGEMAYCLLNIGYRLRNQAGNGFACFLAQRLRNVEDFYHRERFPEALAGYVREYRNRAAHVEKLSRAECLAARAYLIEAPLRLLVILASSLK